MEIKPLLSLVLLMVFFACTKSNEKFIYKGEVTSQPNYCTSSTGFPFIIKYIDKMNRSDSIITTTLPIPYKFIGQKLKFEMREPTSQDEGLACTLLFTTPKQMVIFNVSSN